MKYDGLIEFKKSNKIRIVDNILKLKSHLKGNIPNKNLNDSLLLATWNLRDFDSNKFGHGPRLGESFFYIAEIISSFDLVAIQEVNEDLDALKRVNTIMGSEWDYIVTDITEGKSGNQERMCFMYDKRKIRFTKEAGELVLTKSQLIQGEQQFARTPFKVSFQSGWFKFSLCTVHLYFGSDSGDKLARRIEEIEMIGKSLAKKAKKNDSNIIVLGDFNIWSPEHKTMEALLKSGFVVPEGLRIKTNMKQDKHYDQIAFMLRENELQLGDSKPNSGVYNFYKVLFQPKDYATYQKIATNKSQWKTEKNKKNYYLSEWRTYQMSDHLPLWVELKIDFSDEYLEALTN